MFDFFFKKEDLSSLKPNLNVLSASNLDISSGYSYWLLLEDVDLSQWQKFTGFHEPGVLLLFSGYYFLL